MQNHVVKSLIALGESAKARRAFAEDAQTFLGEMGLDRKATRALTSGRECEIYRLAGHGGAGAPKLVLVPAANLAVAAGAF